MSSTRPPSNARQPEMRPMTRPRVRSSSRVGDGARSASCCPDGPCVGGFSMIALLAMGPFTSRPATPAAWLIYLDAVTCVSEPAEEGADAGVELFAWLAAPVPSAQLLISFQ